MAIACNLLVHLWVMLYWDHLWHRKRLLLVFDSYTIVLSPHFVKAHGRGFFCCWWSLGNQDPKTWNGNAKYALSVVLLQSGREIISNQSPGFLVRTPAISAISLLQWCLLAWVHVPVDAFFVMLFHGLKIHTANAFISFSSSSMVRSKMDHVYYPFPFKTMYSNHIAFKQYGHITRLILNVCYLDR